MASPVNQGLPLPGHGQLEARHALDVTPMLDVLLVLLVIFMASVVGLHRTMDAQLPEPCRVICDAGADPIVLEVLPGSRFLLNKYEVQANELAARIRAVYATRPEKGLGVVGRPGTRYQQVIDAMDVARGSGVRVLAIPPRETR